jgi:hypothetical protein
MQELEIPADRVLGARDVRPRDTGGAA